MVLPMSRCRFSVWDMEGIRLEFAAALSVCVPALLFGCGGVLMGLGIEIRASLRNQLRSDRSCSLTHGMWLWWIFLWRRGICKGILLAAGGIAWGYQIDTFSSDYDDYIDESGMVYDAHGA